MSTQPAFTMGKTPTIRAKRAYTRPLTDLASRVLGGSVVAANDDLFADRAHLIVPGDATHDPTTYGPYGKIYDGWETRRRREEGNDHAIVRLGASGVVRNLVIDTAYFKGNYPTEASVEAISLEGNPSPAEIDEAHWETLLPRSPLKGDFANTFDVSDERCWTHVRLSIYPDGGVARFRVMGDVVPDPRYVTGTVDLAGLDHGGVVLDSSNAFYSPASNLIGPKTPMTIAEGWETARRRDGGNDWVLFQLAGAGLLRLAIIDTSLFYGNAPGEVLLRGIDARSADPADPEAWHEVLVRQNVRPDTRHRFRIRDDRPVTHVRMDVFPDGGMSRVRFYGELSEPHEPVLVWLNALPAGHLEALLEKTGLNPEEARSFAALRPFASKESVPELVYAYLA